MWGIIDSGILFLRPLCLGISQDGERDVLEWWDSNINYRFEFQMQTGRESADSGKWQPWTWGDVSSSPTQHLDPFFILLSSHMCSVEQNVPSMEQNVSSLRRKVTSRVESAESHVHVLPESWIFLWTWTTYMSFFFLTCVFGFFHLYIEKAGPELVIINCFENLAKAVLPSPKAHTHRYRFQLWLYGIGSLRGSRL